MSYYKVLDKYLYRDILNIVNLFGGNQKKYYKKQFSSTINFLKITSNNKFITIYSRRQKNYIHIIRQRKYIYLSNFVLDLSDDLLLERYKIPKFI
jgi:hypothetical protein